MGVTVLGWGSCAGCLTGDDAGGGWSATGETAEEEARTGVLLLCTGASRAHSSRVRSRIALMSALV